MRMAGTISIQFTVPMDVEIAGDDIEANLELEAFKLLKLDDVQMANIDMDIITDHMREVVPEKWLFWRGHCLGNVFKDGPRKMAERMLNGDRDEALRTIISYNVDQWADSEMTLIKCLVTGDFKDYTLEKFAEEMMGEFIGEAQTFSVGFFNESNSYGLEVHVTNSAPYLADDAPAEEVEE